MESDMTLRAKDKDRNHEPWFNDETKKLWENKIFTGSQFAYYKKNLETKLGRMVVNDLDNSTNEILSKEMLFSAPQYNPSFNNGLSSNDFLKKFSASLNC